MRLVSLALAVATASCAAEPPPVAPPPVAPVAPPLAPPAPAPVTVKRIFVSLTRPSGSSVATTSPDGTVTVAFDILENGRGPHVDATFHLSPEGLITSFEGKGHHTFGAPIEESFSRTGSRVRWQGKEEHGDRDAPPNAFFLPFAPVPDALGMLATALLKAGGPLPILPGGEARIEKFADATIPDGAGKRHVIGYAIRGLDFTPSYVWMEEDGRWFGAVDPAESLLPEGFQAAAPTLVALQNAADAARDREVAKLADAPPAAGLAFIHARVLDVEHGKWKPDHTVVVVGDKISSVGPSKGAKIPAGARVIDLAEKALVPGLWDMHAHLGTSDGVLNIASGVTTVRDVGNDPDKLDDYKRRWDAGTAIGPHVYRMGFVEGRGEKAASSVVTAETEAEAKAAVEFYAKRGYDGMKIYNSVKRELIPIITKEAHARGMKVTGHIPVHVLAHEAVDLGYDGIEHVNMLFNNFFASHETDTRDTTRFTLTGENAAGFDLTSKPAKDFFAQLRAHKTVIDPTCDAFEDLLVGKQGAVIPGLEWLVARLPVQVQRQYLAGGLPRDPSKDDLYKRSFDKTLQMVKALQDAKVTVVTGTDALAGLSLHHELQLFVRGGVKPADALRMATLEPARVMGKDKSSGSIDKGKDADLAVVDGDPLARIDDITKVVTTVKSGVVYPSAALFETIGVKGP